MASHSSHHYLSPHYLSDTDRVRLAAERFGLLSVLDGSETARMTDTASGPPHPQSEPAPLDRRKDGGVDGDMDVQTKPLERQDAPVGWFIVLAALVISFLSIGQRDSFGVLQRFYVSDQTFPGTSNLVISLINSLCASVWSVSGPAAAAVSRRLGHRSTILLGGLLICLGDILASVSTQVWHLHITLGLIVGLGLGLCYYPISVLPVQWFRRWKGLAQGVMQCGSGLGGFAISNWTQKVIDTEGLGWRWALRINGLVALVAIFLASRLIRYRVVPQATPPLPATLTGQSSMSIDEKLPTVQPRRSLLHTLSRNVDFWLLFVQGLFTCFSFYVPFLFFPTSAVSVGLTPTQGAFVLSMVNVGSAVGRLAMGLLSDGLGVLNVFLGAMCLCILAVVPMWSTASGLGTMVAAAVVYGLGTGGFVTVEPLTVAHVLGTEDFGAKLGYVFVGFLPGTMAGGPVGGALVDAHTTISPEGVKVVDIWPLCLYTAACKVLSLVFVVALVVRARKRRSGGGGGVKANGGPA